MPKIPGRMRKGKYNLLNRRKSKRPFVERKPNGKTRRFDRRGKLFLAERIKSSVTDKGKHGSGKPYVTEVWRDLQKKLLKKELLQEI